MDEVHRATGPRWSSDARERVMTDDALHGIEIGKRAEFRKTLADTDVYLFTGITSDFDPLNVEEEFNNIKSGGSREHLRLGVIARSHSQHIGYLKNFQHRRPLRHLLKLGIKSTMSKAKGCRE